MRPLARPSWDINHVLSYGQSYANGWEGLPLRTVAAVADALMLGDSVRPWSETVPAWQPVGGAAWRGLRATVQEHFGGPVLSPAQVAAQPAGAALLGETVLEAAVSTWGGLLRAEAALPAGAQLLASACGVGGRSIEALSRGGVPDLFNRLRDCVRAAKALAAAQGRSYGIVAILLLQGEHNNFAMGGTADGAAYLALMRRLYADIVADIVEGIAEQSEQPALLTYQTGGLQASEQNSIPQAQLDAALSLPGCFLAGPAYQLPTGQDHPNGDGYAALGATFGRVLHHVVSRGADWLPLHPISARREGATVRVAFYVPQPQLRWGRPFLRLAPAEVPDRGFVLDDADGQVPLAEVALAGGAEVRLVAARTLRGEVRVRYASAAGVGRGCLLDSAPDPAANWSCAFNLCVA